MAGLINSPAGMRLKEMDKIANLVVGFALSVFLFSSCMRPKALVYQNVQNFRLQQAGLQQTKVSLEIRLYNPNNYKLKLKGSDVDVFLNGNHLGKMAAEENFLIARRDTFSLPVVLDVNMVNVIPNALQLLTNSEVTIKLSGSLKTGRHGVFVTVPVSYEGKHDIGLGIKW